MKKGAPLLICLNRDLAVIGQRVSADLFSSYVEATSQPSTTAFPLGYFEVHGSLSGDEDCGVTAKGKLGAELRLRFHLRSLGSDLTLV